MGIIGWVGAVGRLDFLNEDATLLWMLTAGRMNNSVTS